MSSRAMSSVLLVLLCGMSLVLLGVQAQGTCQNPLSLDGKTFNYRLGEGPTAHRKRLSGSSTRWQDLNSVDYLAPAGTKVVAIVDGTICASCVYGKTEQEKKDRFSLNSFTLNGADGSIYYYTHLATIDVPQGATVKKGQVVATIGAYNGRNPHLHLAIPTGNVCDLLRKCPPVDTRGCQ